MTSYRIDFYQLSMQPTADIDSPKTGFAAVLDGSIEALVADNAGYSREIYGLVERAGQSIGGVLRKFRTDNLPSIGAPGEAAEDIPLEDDEGVIEQNHFVYYQQHNIIGWQADRHGTHPSQFARFLRTLWGTAVTMEPVIQPDAMARLMSGSVELTRIEVSMPRPTNPDVFPDDDFSSALLAAMANAGAQTIKLNLGVDLRRDKGARLKDSMKAALGHMCEMGATKARARVVEDGHDHSIDLVADRVSSVQASESDGRLPSNSMYSLIDLAKAECSEALNEYFSTPEMALV
jgi:hypothetical protein